MVSLFSRAKAQEFTLVASQLCACVDAPLGAYGVSLDFTCFPQIDSVLVVSWGFGGLELMGCLTVDRKAKHSES